LTVAVLVLVLPLLSLVLSLARDKTVRDTWRPTRSKLIVVLPVGWRAAILSVNSFLRSFCSHPSSIGCRWPETHETYSWRHFGFCQNEFNTICDQSDGKSRDTGSSRDSLKTTMSMPWSCLCLEGYCLGLGRIRAILRWTVSNSWSSCYNVLTTDINISPRLSPTWRFHVTTHVHLLGVITTRIGCSSCWLWVAMSTGGPGQRRVICHLPDPDTPSLTDEPARDRRPLSTGVNHVLAGGCVSERGNAAAFLQTFIHQIALASHKHKNTKRKQ